MLNFVDTFELMALNFHGDEEQHHRFVHDAKLLIDAIVTQLHNNDSVFKDHMGELRTTASFISEITMDMPLGFEVFLPIRLPVALSPNFNEEQRSVQLYRTNFSHPFFFGDAANPKCMNLRLQQDMQQVISQVPCIAGYWGAVYDIKYKPMCYNRVPFAHQVFAEERGAYNRGICFDFILVLEFDGAELPLPLYYKAPICYKWFAFGLVDVNRSHDSADWGVLVPRWQSANVTLRLRSHNMLLLLRRLLYAQGCFSLAAPFLIKFCFFMTTVDFGEQYKGMGVAHLMITTLGHQVFRNYCELIVKSAVGDHDANVAATKELREQQMRGKGLFAMLAKGLEMNVVSTQFIADYFQVNYVQVRPKAASTPEPEAANHTLIVTTPSTTAALQNSSETPPPSSPVRSSPASPDPPPAAEQPPTTTRIIARAVPMSRKQNRSI
ncbi:PREDICTED: uncharacterized protein LOC108614203 [Drosophila arizonae]|uniref:Uncharacterized protein LOC108614203 n=1 Tax=Drosophila arizonae TaxID=7263 RepID=A0ABM1P903_DROAR|nr:PREDICTED: uncharacterized protein LOC108614203 [Drosophila arizonae]